MTENADWLDWIEDEVSPFLGGEAMNKDVGDFDVEQLAAAYASLDFVEKQAKKRKEIMRERLLDEAVKRGSTTERGGKVLFTDGAKVFRERRVSKEPETPGVKALLKEKGFKNELVFSIVRKTVLDPSKLQEAVAIGKLDEEDIAALRKVSIALKVTPSARLEENLLRSRKPYLVEHKPSAKKKAPAKKKKAAPRKRKTRSTGARKSG